MSNDLKKIREALEALTLYVKYYSNGEREVAEDALRLFDAHAAAITQQEAEPVAFSDEDILEASRAANIIGSHGLHAAMNVPGLRSFLSALPSSPPKPAALPQPVASVPQDVEEFIVENELPVLINGSKFGTYIRTDDLRTYLAERDAGSATKSQYDSIQEKYQELLWHVSIKHPGESRHETALRYIKQAENQNNPPEANASKEGV